MHIGNLLLTTALTGALALAATSLTRGQDDQQRVVRHIENRSAAYADLAGKIFRLAEVGYQEERSSALLQSELRAAGFTVDAGVAAIPTAFVARYGNGRPIIGILAEFDALPGISQDTTPFRKPLVEGGAGHACGHHLFGTGSTAAAVAVRRWLEDTGRAGSIRLYGTPAEEGGSGKVYMVRAGLFDDVDVVLHWHAGDRNDASANATLANMSAKFRFHGVPSHAAAAPDRGRSALDGVEAMNYMVNLMREHVPQETRMHYVITRGGEAPNVVPEFAEVFYYVRNPSAAVLARLWARVGKAARGAAMGTGTQVDWEIIHGNHSVLPNTTLGAIMDANLRRVGGIHYTPEERRFAERIRETMDDPPLPLGSQEAIQPFGERQGMASSDVGDVSWVVPTAGLRTATWVPGTSAHTWQATAAGGTTIGQKGMFLAAKTLAMTAIDIFNDPSIVQRAREEWQRRRGPDFAYEALLGDRDPPLDYRR